VFIIIKDVSKATDEKMQRERYGGRGTELPCPLWEYHPLGTSSCSVILKPSGTLSFCFLWRLYCMSMTAE
jgi:hypothetical protein